MAHARGARQGKVSPEVESQVERISEKLKIPAVIYDVTRKPTTEFIRNEKPTTEYIRNAKDTTEYIRKTAPTTEFIKNTEFTTKYEEKVEPTTRYDVTVVPTKKYEEVIEKTIKYHPVVENTTKYDVKHDTLDLAAVVKKALDEIIEKDQVVLKRAKYEDEVIKVFELSLTCPHCDKAFSLGGRKK